MAKNPFHQLVEIRKVSARNQPVKDCYRLLYKKTLWEKNYQEIFLTKANVDDNISCLIDQVINQLRWGHFQFSEITNRAEKEYQIVTKVYLRVIMSVMRQIYASVFTWKTDRTSLPQKIIEIKKTWDEVTWVIKGEYIDVPLKQKRTFLLKKIREKVADERFIRLLSQIIRNDRWRNEFPELDRLFQNIYFSALDTEMMCEPFSEQIKYIRYQEEFLIGIKSRKKNAVNVQQEISLALGKKTRFLCLKMNNSIRHIHQSTLFFDCDFFRIPTSSDNPTNTSFQFHIPDIKLKQYVQKYNYGNIDNRTIEPRKACMHYSEEKIIKIFQKEIHQFKRKYYFADNFKSQFHTLIYYAKGSLLKTIAMKRRTTVNKIRKKGCEIRSLF